MIDARGRARSLARSWRAAAERVDPRLGSIVGGVLVGLLAWPPPITDVTGLDPSWRAALHLAASRGLDWGTDLAFTYGPLGFLTVPWPIYGPTSLLAIVASGALFLLLSVAVVWIIRRSMPAPLALLVAFALVRCIGLVLPPAEQALVVVFIAAVEIIRRGQAATWQVVALGLGCGLAVLVKFSLALPMVAIAAVIVLAAGRARLRDAALVGTMAVVAFALGWILTGQAASALAPYLRAGYDAVAGYNSAMGRPLSEDRQWQLVAVGAVWAVVVGAAWILGKRLQPARRWGIAGVVLVVLVVEWKLALRPFPTYVAATAAGALIPFLGVLRRSEAGLAVTLAVVVSIAVSGIRLQEFIAPIRSIRNATAQAVAVVRVDRVGSRADMTFSTIRRELAIPDPVIADLAGRTTHIEPFETSVAMAWPEIVWRPLPAFQSYVAYTRYLDSLNASTLASDKAPERILRQSYDVPRMTTIHGRYRWFESPATNLAMLCRYQQAVVTDAWLVLERIPTRCDQPIPLGTVTVPSTEAVPVPTGPPGSIVIAEVTGLDGSPLDRLRTIALRGQDWYVRLDDRPAYRLVAETAGNGLLMAVPSSIDHAGSFAFGPAIHTVAIGRNPSMTLSGPAVTYRFLAIPVTGD